MRASLWLFGRELASFEVEWDDDRREVVPAMSREPASPVEATGVPGPGGALADTALGDVADPDVRHMGFGYPLRPKERPWDDPARGLVG